MTAPFHRRGARVAGLAWSGVARSGGEERRFSSARAGEELPADPESLARQFPGRWNPRRALPAGLEPFAAAFALALRAAGWWSPGQRERVAGSLVLGTDSHFLRAASSHAREVEDRARAGSGPMVGLSPSSFLFSLPSSATAVLGILFGLSDYQATVAEGGLSGARALGHALDLLETGRIERAAAGVFTSIESGPAAALLLGRRAEELPSGAGLDLAVVFCLESLVEGNALPRLEESCILGTLPPGEEAEEISAAGDEEIEPPLGSSAAPALLPLARWIAEGPGERRTFILVDPSRPGAARIRAAR